MWVLLQASHNVTWSSVAYNAYHPKSTVYSDLPFQDPTRYILLSFFLHFALFYLLPVPSSLLPPPPSTSTSPPHPSSRSPSTAVLRNYFVSTFHALAVIIYILIWFSTFSPDLSSLPRGIGGGLSHSGDEWHFPILCFSLGYFLYDTACMALHPSIATPAAYAHHVAIGAAFVLGLLFHCCRPFHFLLLLEELSTPFLNLKTILRYSSPAWSEACALLFALTFVGVRMVYGMCIYFYAVLQLLPFLRQASADGESLQMFCAVFQFFLCTASRLLNVYWTALIVRKVWNAVTGQEEGKKKHGRTAGEAVHRGQKETARGGDELTSNGSGGDKMD